MKKGSKLGRDQRQHGLSGTMEFDTFRAMENRVRRNPMYLGVEIHQAWIDDPRLFVAHIGLKPSAQHEIDRIDNSKGYVPGNVRWATSLQQKENRRNTRWIEHNGRRQTLAAWSRELGLDPATLKHRIEVLKQPLGVALVNERRPPGWRARATRS